MEKTVLIEIELKTRWKLKAFKHKHRLKTYNASIWKLLELAPKEIPHQNNE